MELTIPQTGLSKTIEHLGQILSRLMQLSLYKSISLTSNGLRDTGQPLEN